jgi:hypothetical protein
MARLTDKTSWASDLFWALSCFLMLWVTQSKEDRTERQYEKVQSRACKKANRKMSREQFGESAFCSDTELVPDPSFIDNVEAFKGA